MTTTITLEVDGEPTEIVITSDKSVPNKSVAWKIANALYPIALDIFIEKIETIS